MTNGADPCPGTLGSGVRGPESLIDPATCPENRAYQVVAATVAGLLVRTIRRRLALVLALALVLSLIPSRVLGFVLLTHRPSTVEVSP